MNPFDQFDEGTTAVAPEPKANAFDQFDTAAATPANPFDQFDAAGQPDEGARQVASGVAAAVATGVQAMGVPLPEKVVDVVLNKGGHAGDVAAEIVPAIAGQVAGAALGGKPGSVVGGAIGGGAGNALKQGREILRGERTTVGKGELGVSAALGALPLGELNPAAGVVRTAAKYALARGAQGAAMGGAGEAIRQATDEEHFDFKRIASSTLWGGVLAAVLGSGEGVLGGVRARATQRAQAGAAEAAQMDRIVAEELARLTPEEQTAARTEIQRRIDDAAGVPNRGPEFAANREEQLAAAFEGPQPVRSRASVMNEQLRESPAAGVALAADLGAEAAQAAELAARKGRVKNAGDLALPESAAAPAATDPRLLDPRRGDPLGLRMMPPAEIDVGQAGEVRPAWWATPTREPGAVYPGRDFSGVRRPHLNPGEPVNADELAAGDEFAVRGEPVRVTEVTEDGTVKIEDGVKRDIPPGTPIYSDRGEVKKVARDEGFLPGEESGTGARPAPVEYQGFQEGYGDIPGFHLYNLTEDIPGHPKGSTVGRETLAKAGFDVSGLPTETPQTKALRDGLREFADDAGDAGPLGVVPPGFKQGQALVRRIAPSSALPRALREALGMGDAAARGVMSQGAALQKDLRAALHQAQARQPGISRQMSADVQHYLTGQVPLAALAPEVRGPALKVRTFIDALSDRAVREGVVTGELAQRFTDNLGQYLRRSYRIHADPDYLPTTGQVTAAIDAVAAHGGMKRDEAAALVNDLIDRNQRAAQADFLAGRGKLAGKDVGSLVRRKDLLPEIRALLGEIEDPIENIGQTIPRLARLVEQHQSQLAMRDLGLKLGVFRDIGKAPLADWEVGQWVPLVAEGSRTHDVLAGLHTRPEIRDAFAATAASGRVDGVRGLLWDAWRGLSATAKTAKTILNPDSYAPNLVGGIISGAANGNFRVHHLGRGLVLGAEEIGALRWLQGKGYMPKNRAGLQEEIAKLTKLGLRGEHLGAADLVATLDRSVLSRVASKTVRPLAQVYGGTDDLTKYVAWKSEMARYAKVFPTMPREDLERYAAKIVTDTMPTYSRVPKVLRELSQLGFAPTFVNFTYEVFRNTANSLRIGGADLRAGLQSGNGALARAGAARLASVTAVLGLSSLWGVSRLSRTENEVSDEQDAAVRFFGPPWNRNAQLVFNSPVGRDGKVQFSNVSYLVPQALLWDAIGEAARADSPETMADAFTRALGQQFLGLDNAVVLSTALDLARGTDADGRRLFNPESPTPAADRLKYAAQKTIEPVLVDKIRRMVMAARGELSETGRAYSLTEEAKRLAGMRAQTLDANQAAFFAARKLGARFSAAAALYRAPAKRNLSPEQLQAAYDRSEAARQHVFGELQKFVRYGNALNVSEDTLIEAMRKAGVPSEIILGAVDGVYTPAEKTQRETAADIFGRLRALPEEKRQAELRKALLSDPTVAKGLVERAREEARGITPRDRLIRSLGVADGERAGYIKARLLALADVDARRQYLRRLAATGALTPEIVAQLAEANAGRN